jgi:hypothetical protein
MPALSPISEDRPLTPEEESLVRWLLEHGAPKAVDFMPQLRRTRVVSRCPCGCASIDFAVDGRQARPSAGMQVLADFLWQDAEGNRFGVFVFAKEDMLAGLELWSVDGSATASVLPDVARLEPARDGRGAS